MGRIQSYLKIISGGFLPAVGLILAMTSVGAAAGVPAGRGGAGYFVLSGARPDLGPLSGALERSGYPGLPGSYITVGGGGHASIGRLILGGEGHRLASRGNVSSAWKTSLSGSCGFFDIGYVLYARPGLSVYPLFGIGAGSMTLKITPRGSASFEDVLENPGRGSYLQKSGFLMQVALGADRWLGSARGGGRGGFFVGLRAGYAFAPAGGSWELEGTEAAAGPRTSWAGPYIRLVIGAGKRGQ
jgi:hypothetical protein